MYSKGSTTCTCVGRDGRRKNAYPTREGAQRVADYLWEQRRVRLRVYQCDCSGAWHLTSDV